MNAPFGGQYLEITCFTPAVPAGLFIIRKAFPFWCISFFVNSKKVVSLQRQTPRSPQG